jgi:hypothetical protein
MLSCHLGLSSPWSRRRLKPPLSSRPAAERQGVAG